MGVENDVGYQTTFRERHVFAKPLLTANAFLPSSTSEFVSDLRVTLSTQSAVIFNRNFKVTEQITGILKVRAIF